jgi:hypothetical protein
VGRFIRAVGDTIIPQQMVGPAVKARALAAGEATEEAEEEAEETAITGEAVHAHLPKLEDGARTAGETRGGVDLESGGAEVADEAVGRPSLEVPGRAVVGKGAVRGEDELSTGLQEAAALAEIKLGVFDMLKDLGGEDEVEAGIWGGEGEAGLDGEVHLGHAGEVSTLVVGIGKERAVGAATTAEVEQAEGVIRGDLAESEAQVGEVEVKLRARPRREPVIEALLLEQGGGFFLGEAAGHKKRCQARGGNQRSRSLRTGTSTRFAMSTPKASEPKISRL